MLVDSNGNKHKATRCDDQRTEERRGLRAMEEANNDRLGDDDRMPRLVLRLVLMA